MRSRKSGGGGIRTHLAVVNHETVFKAAAPTAEIAQATALSDGGERLRATTRQPGCGGAQQTRASGSRSW